MSNSAKKDVPTGAALIQHFKVCDCHDSWDQCPCAEGGHPDDGSCDCCPFGIGLCGPKSTPVEESRTELYQRAYDDGVEQEQVRIAKELGRLNARERLAWADGFVRAYHLTRITTSAGARCQHVSPTPWGPTQCALEDGHEERHAYSPSENVIASTKGDE